MKKLILMLGLVGIMMGLSGCVTEVGVVSGPAYLRPGFCADPYPVYIYGPHYYHGYFHDYRHYYGPRYR